MKRDWARILTVGGSLLIVQSIFWEYARMQPDNNYFVDPWSHRGIDSIHGTVFAVIGLALLAASLFVASKVTQQPLVAFGTVAGIAVAAALITLVFAGDEDVTIGGDSLGGAVFGLGLGYTLYLAAQRYTERGLGDDATATRALRGGTGALLLVGFLVIGFFIAQLLFGAGNTYPAPIGVLILMTVIGLLTSLMREPSMAANRMLIATTVVAGTAIGMSGAAIRSTLIRLQAEGGNIPGQYRDTQVTWGYFLANIGVMVVFIGAVMLWARRRDIVQSQQRAAKQRAAAEESAQEFAAAN